MEVEERPPPHMIVKRFGCTATHKALYKCFIHSFLFGLFISQLFWEKKLSGLNTYDIAEELVKTMDLPKGLQGEHGRAALMLT